MTVKTLTPDKQIDNLLTGCVGVAKLYKRYGGPFVPMPSLDPQALARGTAPKRGLQIKRRLPWLS